MKNQTKKAENQIGYYNEVAHRALLSAINREALRISKCLDIWEKLEAGDLESQDLPHLIKNDSGYFSKLYESRIWAMIDALKIPTATKEKLFQDSKSPLLSDLVSLLENCRLNLRTGLIPMIGGFRNFEFLPEYFEFVEGKVIPARDVDEKTRPFFEVLADTPEKVEALELFRELAEKMTMFSELLEKSGLYAASENPIIERSNLFTFENGKFKARVEALL